MSETLLTDDLVATFQIEGEPVRGRLARLGPAVDQILRAHDYPEPVANLLGETCALAALGGSSLKFDGRLLVQAQGSGPVRYRVGAYYPSGGLGGVVRSDPHPAAHLVATFQIEGEPVRGRLARLGPAVDQILRAHDYPEPVANLLGETCALAALVGSSLKFDGRLIVQAQGSGAVRYVVADYDTSGGLRGYCRFDPDQVAEASSGLARPGARTLLGDGVFIMTIDQGADMERYQGVTQIEGETLALCAEQRSEEHTSELQS